MNFATKRGFPLAESPVLSFQKFSDQFEFAFRVRLIAHGEVDRAALFYKTLCV